MTVVNECGWGSMTVFVVTHMGVRYHIAILILLVMPLVNFIACIRC